MQPIKNINRYRLNQYLNNFDYINAADYLGQFYIEDKQQQQQLLNTIRTYRAEGRKIQGMMNRANDDEKQAIQFQLGLASNNLPKTFIDSNNNEVENIYTKNYVEAINNLGGKDATSIDILLEGKDLKRYGLFGIDAFAKDVHYKDSGFDLFSKGTGLSKEDLINMGVVISEKDNKTILSISKDNKNIGRILTGLKYVNTNRSTDDIYQPIDENTDGISRYKIRGRDEDGNTINVEGSTTKNALANLPDLIGSMFSSTERGWTENDFRNIDVHKQVYRNDMTPWGIIENVDNKVDNLINKDYSNQTYQILTTSFQGADLAELQSQHNRGIIDNSTYNTMLNQLNQHYLTELAGESYVNNRMWANIDSAEDGKADVSDEPQLIELDSKSRLNLGEVIHKAVYDKNINFQYAVMGNHIGTYIVIPQIEEKGEIKQQEIKIFVEDLFKSDAEKALKRDTKTRAAIELSNMQTYGYEFDIPDSGKLMEVTNDGAVLDNNGYRTSISRDEAINLLNKAFIYQDAIDLGKQNYFNEDGSLRNYLKADEDIDRWSQISMQEIYPNAWNNYIQSLQRNNIGIINVNDNSPMDEQGEADREYVRILKDKMKQYILYSIGALYNR